MTAPMLPPDDRARKRGGEGKALKDEALAHLESIHPVVVRRGRRALLSELLREGSGTIDAVRDAVQLPSGVNPKLFGTVPGLLARAGIIEAAGFVPTRRPVAHCRPVKKWRLSDQEAALAWLQAHPELPSQLTLFPCD